MADRWLRRIPTRLSRPYPSSPSAGHRSNDPRSAVKHSGDSEAKRFQWMEFRPKIKKALKTSRARAKGNGRASNEQTPSESSSGLSRFDHRIHRSDQIERFREATTLLAQFPKATSNESYDIYLLK